MTKAIAKWIAVNGALAAALWFGFVEAVDGARHVGLFLVWALFVLTLFTLSDRFIREATNSDKPMLPNWLTVPFDVAVVLFLAWHAAIASAGAYAVHAVILVGAKRRISELRAKAKDAS